MLTEVASTIPWIESIGASVGVAMVVLFLRYLEKKDKASNDAIKAVASDFSQTIRDVSSDVKLGMSDIHTQTQTILSDSRDREAKLHELIREKPQ